MAELELKTISKVVVEKEKTKRVSLPQGIPQKPILKHSHPHHDHKLQISTIPEVEMRDADPKRPKRSESARSHHSRSSTNNLRKYKSELSVNTIVYENNAYEEEMAEGDRVSKHSFGSRTNSNRSSRNPSVRSLEVQREQYCCKSKWSPCERKLVAVVAVLASIIFILVIVMGLSIGSGGDDTEKRFNYFWKL